MNASILRYALYILISATTTTTTIYASNKLNKTIQQNYTYFNLPLWGWGGVENLVNWPE